MTNVSNFQSSVLAAISAFVFSAIFVGASVLPAEAVNSAGMFI